MIKPLENSLRILLLTRFLPKRFLEHQGRVVRSPFSLNGG